MPKYVTWYIFVFLALLQQFHEFNGSGFSALSSTYFANQSKTFNGDEAKKPRRKVTILECRLSQINALRINLSYSPKDQSLKFLQNKYWELAELKISVFLSQPFWIFLLHSYSSQSQFMGYQGWDKIFMITLISSKKLGGYKIMRNPL